jgi:mannosylfructose-phosphate synthase
MPEQEAAKIKTICMLSTHGYFDPVPQLGRTDTGGQVVYVLQLARALRRCHIKVDIYTRWFDRSKKQIDPLPRSSGVRVMRIPAGPWEFIPKEKIYDFLPELAEKMIAFIREKDLDYDLFHGHYVDGGVVALDVAEEFHKPTFFTAHSLGAWKREQMGGDPEEMERKYKFSRRIAEELRIFESVKAQTVTTTLQEKKLRQLYNFTSDNVVVIPPGVDVGIFRPLKPGHRKAKTNLPDRYIFCLSRIDTNKGHDLLLKAFHPVAKAIPDVHLVIGGGSSKPQQREREVLATLKKIIHEKSMHDRVHIVGYVPDELLVPFYQQAELFVLPSIFEPFGMTALEAMACGTPVVASEFGGIKDAIVSGKNGLLIDPSKTGEFARAMVKLLKDKKLVENMGREGCRSISEHFSWEAIARRHIAFYQRFIGTSVSPGNCQQVQ